MPTFPHQDDGRVIQGWSEGHAPVLRSDWAWDGLLLRQEVFAHIPGAEAVKTGIEPLFAWVRLSIVGTVEGLPLEEKYGFAIKLNAPHISRTMSIRNDIIYHADQSQYPRPLSPENAEYSSAAGYRLVESDGRVRLGFVPGQQCTVGFTPKKPTERDSLLFVQLEARKGAQVDLLLPMLPVERAVFDKELALGYERALAEANQYWSKTPAEAAADRNSGRARQPGYPPQLETGGGDCRAGPCYRQLFVAHWLMDVRGRLGDTFGDDLRISAG